MHALAADPQRLAARRENTHVIKVADKSIHGSSYSRQQMLAIVEQKHHWLGLQRMYDACERIPARHTKAERRGDCCWYELRVADRRKVDECGTVGALPCRRNRDRRFAYAAGADNRHESRLIHITSNGIDRIGPAEDAGCSGWQVMATRSRRGDQCPVG